MAAMGRHAAGWLSGKWRVAPGAGVDMVYYLDVCMEGFFFPVYSLPRQGETMTDSVIELDLVVGSLITIHPDEDSEAFEEERALIVNIEEELRTRGINIDLQQQPGTEVWEGGIETLGALYQLSRLATHLENDKPIDDVLEDGPVIYDELDRAVTDVWDEQVPTRFPNLVNLQGHGSYYLPVDFDPPFVLEESEPDEEGEQEEAFFGSSVRLQRELTDLAEMLKQASVPTNSSAFECLYTLREAAGESLRYHLPLIVW
jgi:hypothetical protein